MPMTITDFWGLLIESQLFTAERCQKLAAKFEQSKHASDTTPRRVAAWLLSHKALSKYQATVLLAGRPGPFHYGDYRVYDRIDAGRLTGCFRAVHLQTVHPVVLAFMSGPLVQQPHVWTQFAYFVRQQTGIVHPNVVRWFELVETDAYKFLALEDLRGETLEERLAANGVMPPIESLKVVLQAARGAAALHETGLAHGDLRPENLWIEANGNVKVMRSVQSLPGPFNLALVDPTGQMAKQADYWAPEFLQPGKVPDALTDIYALGCTFYQLLTGSPPFPGGDVQQKLHRHATEPIQSLEKLGVPPPVVQMVAYMMAKNPGIRIPTAQHVADQLSSMLGAQAPVTSAEIPASLVALEQAIQRRLAGLGPVQNIAPTGAAPSFPTVQTQPNIASQPIIAGQPNVAGQPGIQVQPTAASGPRIQTVNPAAAPAQAGSRPAVRKKKSPMPLVFGVGGGMVALIIVVTVIANMNNVPKPPPEPSGPVVLSGSPSGSSSVRNTNAITNVTPPTIATKDGSPASIPPDATASMPALIADDGKALWASPTNGKPIDFQYTPAGAQILVHVRLAEIAQHPEGSRVLRCFGPAFDDELQKWQKAAGVEMDEIESILITFHDDPKSPQPCLVVHLKGDADPDKLWERWGSPEPKTKGKFQIADANGWTIAVPETGDGCTFIMGRAAEIDDIVERNGAPPPANRWIDRLRQYADDQRQLTIFFTPHSVYTEFFRDGREWSFCDVMRTRGALQAFLGDEVQGGLVSVHLDDAMYIEMRIASDVKKDRYTMASEFRDRLGKMRDEIEEYMVRLNPPDYWRSIAFRYPAMIKYLHSQSRIGVDGDQALMNAYLPLIASHNLFFGGAMALASTPGGVAVAAGPMKTANGGAAAGPKNVDEVLRSKMTFMIAQQDLVLTLVEVEKSVNEEFKSLGAPFKIKMMGNDLKMEGITQNQKVVDFKMENAALSDILTGLMRKANPDPTVKDASEPGQKLIWVVGPDPDDKTKQAIIVTTRAGAERDGHKLPTPFQLKP